MSLRLPFKARSALAAFRTLERVSDLRGNVTAGASGSAPAGPVRPSWWVFVSTIGELNATAPVLEAIRARMGELTLVLVTDHPHYRESFLARFPEAEVFVTLGHSSDAAVLAQMRPPRLLVVAEIPLIPSDAPCRCSAAFLLEARMRGARLVAVNGWLYHYQPPCRMDAIERSLLARATLEQFDAICVQTDSVRQGLLTSGAPADRLHVCGNLKFDALRQSRAWHAADARSPALVQGLIDSGRAVIVAGSLTRHDELQAVIDAFVAIRREHTRALLVIAPRHPEVTANLDDIETRLAAGGLVASWRSRIPDAALPDRTDVLVVDTMGELRDLYAVSQAAHVGVDHNVLEPLTYFKPTSVLPGWESTFPSFPVYTMLRNAGALMVAEDAHSLVVCWRDALAGRARSLVQQARDVLMRSGSSLDQHLEALAPVLDSLRPMPSNAR